MLIIFPIVFSLGAAWGEQLPLRGLTLNKNLKLREVAATQSPTSFQSSLSNDQFDIVIKGTLLPSAEAAKSKATMELANIENLYKPRTNPYEGQVSDLVQCSKTLMPKLSEIKNKSVAGAKLLVAAATERKLFGACSKDQVAYWAGYFQFFNEADRMAVEVRVFERTKSAGGLAQAQRRIQKLSDSLFATNGAER